MFESLRSVSDQQILINTEAIVAQDRKLTLKLLIHLHEIEHRKLHLQRGFASMFEYCTAHLRLSEPAAVRRIRTARCLVRFPQLAPLLESGEVSLMSVSLIARFLNAENAAVMIERIRGKSKREVEAIVAGCEPRTMLPPDRVRTVVIPVVAPTSAPLLQATVTGDGKKSATVENGDPTDHHAKDARTLPRAAAAPDAGDRLERRSVVQFSAREAFMTKVERARALVWHQMPGATFEQLFELALDELIARRDPQARQKRREGRRSSAKRPGVKGGRYVPVAIRDEVFARDRTQCTFIGANGRRCTATVGLQVDHVKPVARGGACTATNLRILCAQHNRLEAERLMGPWEPLGRTNSR